MKNAVIKYGSILGLISIIITMLIYLLNIALFAKIWLLFVILLVNILIIIYFGIQFRNQEHEGYISFKNSFIFSFLTFFVGGLIGTAFMILLFNVIDKEAVDQITEATVENTISMMERFNVPEADMEEAIDQVRKDTPDRFTVLGQIKGLGSGLIIYAILSLITGAIIKRKKKEDGFNQ